MAISDYGWSIRGDSVERTWQHDGSTANLASARQGLHFSVIENVWHWQRPHIRATAGGCAYLLNLNRVYFGWRPQYDRAADHDGLHDHVWNYQPSDVLRRHHQEPELPPNIPLQPLEYVATGSNRLRRRHVTNELAMGFTFDRSDGGDLLFHLSQTSRIALG